MSEKRISELTEVQTFDNNDYIAIDDINKTEAKKIKAKTVGKTYTIEDTEDGFTFAGDNGYSHHIQIPDVEIEEKTASGEIATFEDGGENIPMKSVVCEINPVQDLHGYDNPWAGGAGKNKLQVKVNTTTKYGVTFTVNEDGSVKVEGATTTENVFLNLNYEAGIKGIPVGEWKIGLLSNDPNIGLRGYVSSLLTDTAWGMNFIPVSVEEDDTQSYVRIQIALSVGITVNTTVYPMILSSDETDTTWQPYSNICPISGFTEANIVVSPTTDAEDGTTYNIQFKDGDNPLTVYGGTLDVVSGELVVTYAKIALADISKSKYGNYQYGIRTITNFFDSIPNSILLTGMSNTFVLSDSGESYDVDMCSIVFAGGSSKTSVLISTQASGLSADASVTEINEWLRSIDAYIVYPLATPITYQLTPTEVKSLLGTNNVWHDCNGDISVTYVKGNLGGYVYGLDKEIENVDTKVENIKTELGTAELQTTDKTIKGAINEIDNRIIHAASDELISDAYDNTATYSVGDTCIYNNKLYVCNTDISTPEDFDSTKWDEDTIGHYCSELKSNLTDKVYFKKATVNGAVAGGSTFSLPSYIADWKDSFKIEFYLRRYGRVGFVSIPTALALDNVATDVNYSYQGSIKTCGLNSSGVFTVGSGQTDQVFIDIIAYYGTNMQS